MMTPEEIDAAKYRYGLANTSGISGVGRNFANPSKVTPPGGESDANNRSYQSQKFGRALTGKEADAFDNKGIQSSDPSGGTQQPKSFGGMSGSQWAGIAGSAMQAMKEDEKPAAPGQSGALPSLSDDNNRFARISKFGYRR